METWNICYAANSCIGLYLCLWIDFSAVLFKDLSYVDLVFLCTQMHWRQAVLCSAVGVSAVVQQQSRYIRIAEW